MLGFELALNFNLPYFATSPKDFWLRWHISLSTWLRDYLYIPIGGSRSGVGSTLTRPALILATGLGAYYLLSRSGIDPRFNAVRMLGLIYRA